jgi:hypothetical protein
MFYVDKCIYKGFFANDMRQGLGILRIKSGDVILGYFDKERISELIWVQIKYTNNDVYAG